MGLTLRPMTRQDVPEVLELWNADYVHHQLSSRRLERVVFNDPHHDEDGTLVAGDDGRIVGFVCCVAPVPAVGWVGPVGFLKALCATGYEPGEPADCLLAAAERFTAARGKGAVHVIEYAGGGHFFPGIDLRYEDKVGFFRRNGYEQTGEIHDVALDLTDFSPSPWAEEAQQKAAEDGIEIVAYDPAMLDMLRELVAAIKMRQWFREGWERRYSSKRHTFVAIQGDRMLGYADYRPNPERGSFGTTAVLPELRGRGIGSCLLTACMLALKEAGTPRVVAGWANTPFYLKNGWHICRRYAVFHKRLQA